MKFCKAFEALFSEDELKYIVKEASLYYENENNEVDYILWLRTDKHQAEIRVGYGSEIKIWRLDEHEDKYYEKDDFLEMLQNSKLSKLEYLEVD